MKIQEVLRILSSPNKREKYQKEYVIVFTNFIHSSEKTKENFSLYYLNFLRFYKKLKKILVEKRGKIIKFIGDSFLIVFRDIYDAIDFSIHVQNIFKKSKYLKIGIGMSYGKVYYIDNDVFGPDVNLAAKLGEDTAEANEILISSSIREKIKRTIKLKKAKDHYKIIF